MRLIRFLSSAWTAPGQQRVKRSRLTEFSLTHRRHVKELKWWDEGSAELVLERTEDGQSVGALPLRLLRLSCVFEGTKQRRFRGPLEKKVFQRKRIPLVAVAVGDLIRLSCGAQADAQHHQPTRQTKAKKKNHRRHNPALEQTQTAAVSEEQEAFFRFRDVMCKQAVDGSFSGGRVLGLLNGSLQWPDHAGSSVSLERFANQLALLDGQAMADLLVDHAAHPPMWRGDEQTQRQSLARWLTGVLIADSHLRRFFRHYRYDGCDASHDHCNRPNSIVRYDPPLTIPDILEDQITRASERGDEAQEEHLRLWWKRLFAKTPNRKMEAWARQVVPDVQDHHHGAFDNLDKVPQWYPPSSFARLQLRQWDAKKDLGELQSRIQSFVRQRAHPRIRHLQDRGNGPHVAQDRPVFPRHRYSPHWFFSHITEPRKPRQLRWRDSLEGIPRKSQNPQSATSMIEDSTQESFWPPSESDD